MTSWCKKNLGDAMLASEALSLIQMHLARLYEATALNINGKTENLLAIYRHESQGLHCSVIIYLTTEFQHIALLDSTRRCDPPSLLDAAFLAGNEVLFRRCNK